MCSSDLVAGQAAVPRLLDSYELCKIGRMGQHELSFLTVFILIGCFIFFLQIDRRLIKHGWEIRKALSESSELSFVPEGSNSKPLLNQSGDPVSVRVMEPSVSRLIALCGLIMLILFYFGFGLISLYHFGRTCEMPGDIQGVTTFLYAGLTFFAPYLVSKVSAIFGTPGRRLPPPSAHPDQQQETAEPPLSSQTQAGLSGIRGTAPAPAAAIKTEPPSANGQLASAQSPTLVTTPSGTQLSPSSPSMAVASATVAAAPAPSTSIAPQHLDGVALIKEFEGFRDQAYPDPASGGDPWTIGYGFTRIDNKPVVPGQSISKSAADQLLGEMLAAMANRYSTKIPYWNEMDDKQQSCLLSFGWNLGENFYGDESGFHTITQCLRNKDWPKVPEALLLYCMPGTAVHAGLLRRRNAEADLWKRGLGASPSPSANASATSTITGSASNPNEIGRAHV